MMHTAIGLIERMFVENFDVKKAESGDNNITSSPYNMHPKILTTGNSVLAQFLR